MCEDLRLQLRLLGPLPIPQIHTNMSYTFWHDFLKTPPIKSESMTLIQQDSATADTAKNKSLNQVSHFPAIWHSITV